MSKLFLRFVLSLGLSGAVVSTTGCAELPGKRKPSAQKKKTKDRNKNRNKNRGKAGVKTKKAATATAPKDGAKAPPK